jgi:hypothetical protein
MSSRHYVLDGLAVHDESVEVVNFVSFTTTALALGS